MSSTFHFAAVFVGVLTSLVGMSRQLPAQQAAAPRIAPEFTVGPGEIRLDGRVEIVDSGVRQMVLVATVFVLPNGKAAKLPSPKEKTLLLDAHTMMHVRGDSRQRLELKDINPLTYVIAIGADRGSGKALKAREIAVWDTNVNGVYALRRDPTVGLAAPPNALQPPRHSGKMGTVWSVAFSPNGKSIAASAGTLDIVRGPLSADQRNAGLFVGPTNAAQVAQFAGAAVTLWDPLASVRRNPVSIFHDGPPQLAGVGSPMVSQSELIVPDMSEGYAISGFNGNAWPLCYAPDGKTIAAGGADGNITLIDAANARIVSTISAHSGHISALAYSPDGALLASAAGLLKKRDPNAPISANSSAKLPAEIKIWDARTGQLLRTIAAREATVTALVFSPDSKTLAIASAPLVIELRGQRAVILVDAANGEVKQRLPTDAMWVGALTFSADGTTLAGACCQRPYLLELNAPDTTGHNAVSGFESLQAGQLRVWDTASGKLQQSIACGPVAAVDFSPDGKQLIAGGADLFRGVSTVTFWDLVTAKLVRTIDDPNALMAMAPSPDGRSVAVAGSVAPGIDGVVTLYDAITGDRVAALASHPDN